MIELTDGEKKRMDEMRKASLRRELGGGPEMEIPAEIVAQWWTNIESGPKVPNDKVELKQLLTQIEQMVSSRREFIKYLIGCELEANARKIGNGDETELPDSHKENLILVLEADKVFPQQIEKYMNRDEWTRTEILKNQRKSSYDEWMTAFNQLPNSERRRVMTSRDRIAHHHAFATYSKALRIIEQGFNELAIEVKNRFEYRLIELEQAPQLSSKKPSKKPQKRGRKRIDDNGLFKRLDDSYKKSGNTTIALFVERCEQLRVDSTSDLNPLELELRKLATDFYRLNGYALTKGDVQRAKNANRYRQRESSRRKNSRT